MISKISAYFKGARQEFKHIQWPDTKTTSRLTLIVVVISLVIAIYLGIFDQIFQYALKLII